MRASFRLLNQFFTAHFTYLFIYCTAHHTLTTNPPTHTPTPTTLSSETKLDSNSNECWPQKKNSKKFSRVVDCPSLKDYPITTKIDGQQSQGSLTKLMLELAKDLANKHTNSKWQRSPWPYCTNRLSKWSILQ